MDLEHLKRNAGTFAYQLRKNFPEGESPISHFVCEKQVVVLSNQKLYIFFCDTFIDYKNDKLPNVTISDIDLVNGICNILLERRLFHVSFATMDDLEYFMRLFNKYKQLSSK